jgi:putative oxidoreductase
MSMGRLAVRAVIGGLFVGHGTQKLFGWFGGPGREGTRAMMDAIEMRPAHVHAALAGGTEAAGGALLAAGLATPLAASSLIGVMTTAIRKVHLPKGVWVTNGGWEYNAVLIATLFGLAESGPGRWSLDAALGIEKKGPKVALAALGLGVGTAFATMAVGSRMHPSASTYPTEPAAVTEPQAQDVAGDPTMTDAEPR